MKVSYLIGLYNKESYIVDCVNSILKEASDELEIEVCVVDDGSTDNSLQIVKNNYLNNNNVKIFSLGVNKGKNSAYNKAFEICSGDYICIFGADDLVVSGRTRKMLDSIIEKKIDIAIYGGLISKNQDLSVELNRIILKKPSLYEISIQNSLAGGCCMIPRNLCNKIFPIPSNLKFEDWWVAYKLVLENKVLIINDYVTFYRIGDNNEIGFNTKNLFSLVSKDYARHLEYIEEFKRISDNIFLDKSLDLRKAFFGEPVNKLIYLKPFDKFSLKIILFYLFGSKSVYKILGSLNKILKK